MRKLMLAARRTAHTPARSRQGATSTAEAADLSATTRRLVDGIRDEFDTFVEGFNTLESDRGTLAPHFMKAFNAWAKDTEGTFVSFVRLLVPKVPEDRDGYRAHPAYQAADYLRRKVADAGKPERTEVPLEERPKSPLVALSFMVATVMPIVDPTGSIWSAFVKEMNWDGETAQRIRERATKLGPVKLPARTKHQLEAHAAVKAA